MLYATDKRKRLYNKPPFNPRNSNNMHNECNGWKQSMCFICVSEDHFIAIFPKTIDLDKNVHWNTEKPKTCSYRSRKIDKTLEKVQMKASRRRYTCLWHVLTG